MSAAALIQFDQDPGSSWAAGEAAVGVLAQTVTAYNADDTGAITWEWALVDVPVGSRAAGAPWPAAPQNFSFIPDVPGTYRVRLIVRDALGVADTDIRCFCVALPNGLIKPPYQVSPPQLPLPGAVGGKPGEMNVGGQARGWQGGTVGAAMLDETLSSVDWLAEGHGGQFVTPAGQANSYVVLLQFGSVAVPDVLDSRVYVLRLAVGYLVANEFGVISAAGGTTIEACVTWDIDSEVLAIAGQGASLDAMTAPYAATLGVGMDADGRAQLRLNVVSDGAATKWFVDAQWRHASHLLGDVHWGPARRLAVEGPTGPEGSPLAWAAAAGASGPS